MKTSFSVLFIVLLAARSTVASRAADVPATPAPVTVTITATDPTAAEVGPSTALFTVRRTGPSTDSLTVAYRTSGTAVNGVDYTALPGSVTIPAGESAASLLVTPIDDGIAEGPETVVLTIISPIQPLAATAAVSSALYNIGEPRSATAVIKDNDRGRVLLPTINIKATDAKAAEPDNVGRITISRVGAVSNALEVAYEVLKDAIQSMPAGAGPIVLIPAATPGVDYQALPGTITIPAGHEAETIVIAPIDDQLVEGQEHVTLKIKSSTLYNINQPDTATVLITSDDPVNQPPVVKIATPTSGQSFPALSDLSIAAAASDPDGSVLTVQFFANDKSLGVTTNNPASASPVNPFQLTWKKVPAGRYALTAKAIDNQGRATTSPAVYIEVVEAVPGTTLIPLGAVWKYLDNGSDPGKSWRDPGFDDSKWASGPAQLGYGDGDEATVVGFGPDPSHKYITTYFRHTFEVPDPTQVSNLVERILREDGGVAYLNGTEISHGNMPDGIVTNATLAVAELTGASESALHFKALDSKLLVKGANVLAVEVHLASAASPDMSFDFELIGNAQLPTEPSPTHATLVIDSPKDGATFVAPAHIPITATAVDPKGYISRVEFFANDKSIGVSEMVFIRAPDPGTPIKHMLDWNNVPAGKYAIIAKAKDSAGAIVTSGPVTVIVTASPTSVARLTSLTPQLTVTFNAEPGRVYRIQASADLENWTDLGTVENVEGMVEAEVPSSGAAYQFYRAIPAE